MLSLDHKPENHNPEIQTPNPNPQTLDAARLRAPTGTGNSSRTFLPSKQTSSRLVCAYRFQANMARVRQSRPDAGFDFQVQVFITFQDASSLRGNRRDMTLRTETLLSAQSNVSSPSAVGVCKRAQTPTPTPFTQSPKLFSPRPAVLTLNPNPHPFAWGSLSSFGCICLAPEHYLRILKDAR